MKRRWTKQEDQILVDVIFKHIEKGSTQIAGFLEAGERLDRSSEACGFRWNSVLRKRHLASLQVAQEQARPGRTKPRPDEGEWNDKTIIKTVNWIIRYLRWWRDRWTTKERERKELKEKIRRKEELIRQLKRENERLQKERLAGTVFKMETNGNLVREG